LLQYYKSNPDFIFPQSRYNEVVRFVEGGLKDLSVSRTSFSWGVPVPGDSQHIMYVWLDALANYLTALGFPDLNAQLYKRFWGNAFHVVGKDILRFHAVYWPAFLMAADLPLPKKIIAHGWWTNEGQKISKSLGNVIDPHGLLQEFGRDATRYFLMREVPFGQDGNFACEQMIMRMNAELANNIGNLCQRTLSFVQKHTGGNVPLAGELSAEDKNLRTRCRDNSRYLRAMNGSVFSEALEETVELAMSANQYIDQQAPWNLKKQGDEKRLATVLVTLLEALHALAVRLQPFIPEASEAMLIQLGYTPETAARGVMLQNITKGYTYVGALPAPSPVFPRFLEK
jgi:methionyl-tRNA synthetase